MPHFDTAATRTYYYRALEVHDIKHTGLPLSHIITKEDVENMVDDVSNYRKRKVLNAKI